MEHEVHRPFADRLRDTLDHLPAGGVTLNRLADLLGGGTAGTLLMLLGLLSMVPSPGIPLGMVSGSALVAVGLRMAAGRTDLPEFIGRRAVGGTHLAGLLGRIIPWAERAERMVRPRLAGLLHPAARPAHAVLVVLLGILIALPIPLGNTLPGAAVALLGIGITVRDGAAVLAALACSLLALAWCVVLVWAGMAAIA